MNINALQRPASLVEVVCNQLTQLIQGITLKDDRWLPGERSLAEQLGVSRTVVREATKRLEQKGLLEIQHGTGIKVVNRLHRPLNNSLTLLIPDLVERLRQLNQARLSIEPAAAALAAERASKEQVQLMRSIQCQLEKTEDNAATIEADLEWHRAIVDASGNQIFRLILDSFGELGFASRLRTIGRLGKAPAAEQHAMILDAIERRDPEGAASAMCSHISSALNDMDLTSLESHQP